MVFMLLVTDWSVISRLRCQSFLPYLKVSIISEVVNFLFRFFARRSSVNLYKST